MTTGLSGFYTPDGLLNLRAALASAWDPWTTAAANLNTVATRYAGHKPSPVATWYSPGVYEDPAGAQAAMGPFIYDCDAAFLSAMNGYVRGQIAPTAMNIVRAWTSVNKGVSNYSGPEGNQSYLAFCTEGNGLVQAAILCDLSQLTFGWSPTDQANVKKWLTTYYVPVGQAILGPQHMTNNWADWALFALALSARYLADNTLRDWCVKQLRAHILHAINPTSTPPFLLPEEMMRGASAVNYEAFSLNPMMSAALVLESMGGEDLISAADTGPLIRGAITTLLSLLQPLMSGQKPAYADACDLYELAGAVYGSGVFKTYARPYRPILTIGQHLSLATCSTLTAIPAPERLPSRRLERRRKADTGPLDMPPATSISDTSVLLSDLNLIVDGSEMGDG